MRQTSCFQKFVDNAQQCFAFTSQAKLVGSNPGYMLKSFYFTLCASLELNCC